MVLQPSYLSRHQGGRTVSPTVDLLAAWDKCGKHRHAEVQGSRSTGLDDQPDGRDGNRCNEELQENMEQS